ncbi:MAG TPA: xanthine dehydrogenase family protein subunit M [Terriglobales bacterium]|nr:xanthine dehydrogenase family protein subunit M [Terriglobales bacterium]
MWSIAIDEPKPFELLSPRTLDEALELASRHGVDAAFLAGGCDLIDQLKHQWSTPHYVINLKTIPGLRYVEPGSQAIRMGALSTLAELERNREIRSALPGLARAAARVATPQIRNLGTLGGNLLQDSRCPYYRGPWYCYRHGGIVCDARHGVNAEHAIFGGNRCYTVTPSDTAPMLVALDARVTIAGRDGPREMPLAEMFVGPEENILVMHRLRPNEILASVTVPRRPDQRSTFIKYAMRGSWDFALASVAVAFTAGGGYCRDARIVLGGVAPVPWRSAAAEREIEGRPLTATNIESAARAAIAGAEPLAHNEYKLGLVKKLVRAALTELAS